MVQGTNSLVQIVCNNQLQHYGGDLYVGVLTVLLPMAGLGVEGVFLAKPISNAVGGLGAFTTMYITIYRKL